MGGLAGKLRPWAARRYPRLVDRKITAFAVANCHFQQLLVSEGGLSGVPQTHHFFENAEKFLQISVSRSGMAEEVVGGPREDSLQPSREATGLWTPKNGVLKALKNGTFPPAGWPTLALEPPRHGCQVPWGGPTI